eukprot:c119_g2_i1 orf=430-1005(+)
MAALDVSLKAGSQVELLLSAGLLCEIQQSSIFPRSGRTVQRCQTQPRRLQMPFPQIFADITPRFYSIRRNSAYHHDADTRVQSLGHNTGSVLVKTVAVQVAHELLNAGHRYLDVRTPEEFAADHVHGAINIPYMYRVGKGMTRSLNFVQQVLLQFGRDDEIVVGCQKGGRSQMAAVELVAAGFTGVTDMAG